jgi:ubiquitin-like domain-containing CTD phosphatase 1
VPVDRLKLLGLKAGTADGALLKTLSLPRSGLVLLGTPSTVIQAEDAAAAAAPDLLDDLLDDEPASTSLVHNADVQAKLVGRIVAAKHLALNPPREGKKLLVLDIDYTLMDHRSSAERPEELARPFLHDFLASAHRDYDIILWSATGMMWIDVKMRELGVSTSEAFKIVAHFDHRSMVTVGPLERYGVFNCNPLAVLWAAFPMYNACNTVMLDDLRRNFVLNPQNGLRIRPFRDCHLNRETDDELRRLAIYLRAIASLDSFAGLDHSRWERYKAE